MTVIFGSAEANAVLFQDKEERAKEEAARFEWTIVVHETVVHHYGVTATNSEDAVERYRIGDYVDYGIAERLDEGVNEVIKGEKKT